MGAHTYVLSYRYPYLGHMKTNYRDIFVHFVNMHYAHNVNKYLHMSGAGFKVKQCLTKRT